MFFQVNYSADGQYILAPIGTCSNFPFMLLKALYRLPFYVSTICLFESDKQLHFAEKQQVDDNGFVDGGTIYTKQITLNFPDAREYFFLFSKPDYYL